jgi:predicted phage baseplate assembly protein
MAVYVGGSEWQRVDSLFGRGAEEQVYIVREDASGNSWVQFGDGRTGARLPNGVGNVTAVQRMGAGSFGPLKDDTKVQALAKLKNFDKVQMPDVVAGGAPPESGDNARDAAPAKVQSLGRMVSLEDFEAEAAAIPGVARAGATWQLEDNLPAVTVTVLLETGRSAEVTSVSNHIREYNLQRGAGRTSINVLEGKRLYVTVSVQYALKPGYRADLVEPGDGGELTHAIDALLDDPERRARMGAAGRRRVEEHFSWHAVAQATAAAYEEAIRAHR